MKRREFMKYVGAASLVVPTAVHAEQNDLSKIPAQLRWKLPKTPMTVTTAPSTLPTTLPPPPPGTPVTIPPNFQWVRLPGTALAPVVPSKTQLGVSWGVEGPSAIIADWTSAGLSGHKMIIAAQGGHNGYGGNETYQIDLDAQTAKRLCDPAPYPPKPWAHVLPPTYGPAANHGYDGVQVCPLDGKLYMWGSYGFDPMLGYPYTDGTTGLYYLIANELWVCDLTKMPNAQSAWTKKVGVPYGTAPYNALGGQYSATWVTDVDKFLIFYNGNTIWYDPVADSYSAWRGGNVYGSAPRGCYVRHRSEVWWICGGDGESVIASAGIANPSASIKIHQVDMPSGIDFQGGFDYDPTSKHLVLWSQRGDLWFLNPDTLQWRHFVPASGATAPNSTGVPVYGKFRLLPDIRACIALIDMNGLWAVKLGDVLSLPLWTKPTPPVTVTNIDGTKYGPYTSVQLAHDAATTKDGATINIAAPPADPGFWSDAAIITKNGIRLIGAPGCRIAGALTDGGTGTFSIKGNDFFADNIEGYGCRGDGSASFFRLIGTNATFGPGIYLHDNDMGILAGTNFNSTVTLNGCRFYNNGLTGIDGKAHNIYIGQVKLLVATGITTTAAIDGHCFKSRALETRISGGTFDGRNSTTSRMIDIPWGGTVRISGATLYQCPTNNVDMIGIDLETGEVLPAGVTRTHSTLIQNCAATTTRNPSYFVNTRSPAPVVVNNCTFKTTGGFLLGFGSGVVTGTNNLVS